MRNLTMFGVAAIAVTAAIGVQAQDKDPRTGRKPPQIPQTIPPSPFPGSSTPSSTPGPVINQPSPFNGPSVPLRVTVRGDGGVRWDAQFCGTADGENIRTCQSGANQGSLVRFDVEPRPGMSFTGWGGDCLKSGSTNTAYTCILSATKPLDVVAGFAPKSVSVGKVQISVDIPYAGGSVRPATFADGNINCNHPLDSAKPGFIKGKVSGQCWMWADKGSDVTLSAIPDAGGKFNSWVSTIPGCSKTSGTNCAFTADKDVKLTANFGPNSPYTIKVATTETKTEKFRVWSNFATFNCTTGSSCTATNAKYGTLRIFGVWVTKNGNKKIRDAKASEWGGCPDAHDYYCEINVNKNWSLSLTNK